MNCPLCSGESGVSETRSTPGSALKSAKLNDLKKSTADQFVRRRRYCFDCSHKWTTYEFTEADFHRIAEVADSTPLLNELKAHAHAILALTNK